MATAVIDCDFDSGAAFSGAGGYAEAELGAQVALRHDTAPAAGNSIVRMQLRFPLAGVSADSTVTDSDLQCNKTAETVAAGEDINVHAYNSTGDDDPDADAAQAKYDRSIGGSALVQLVGNGTGTVTADLTVTADAQIQGNITTPGIYTIGLAPDADWDDADSITIEAIENAGTDPATLTIVFTPPAGTINLRTLMGAGI